MSSALRRGRTLNPYAVRRAKKHQQQRLKYLLGDGSVEHRITLTFAERAEARSDWQMGLLGGEGMKETRVPLHLAGIPSWIGQEFDYATQFYHFKLRLGADVVVTAQEIVSTTRDNVWREPVLRSLRRMVVSLQERIDELESTRETI